MDDAEGGEPPATGAARRRTDPAPPPVAADSIRVLHVDDEPSFAAMAAEHLERQDDRLSVTVETSPGDALDRLEGVDCVVSDYDMAEMDGLAFFERVDAARPGLPFILFTGKGSEEIAAEAISAGVTDYLQKESGPDQYTLLARRVTNAVARQRARTDYRQIFHDVTDGVTVHDPETGEILDANRRFCELLGYDREDLLGMTIEECSATDRGYTAAVAREHVRRAFEEGIERFEWADETADGEVVPVEVTLQPTRLGGRECVLAVVQDISERKASQRRIEDLETYREMVEAVEDGVYVLDADQRFVAVNDAMARITGYPREKLLGAHLSKLVDDSEVTASRRLRERLAADEERTAATMVARHRTADGDAVPCEVRFAPRFADDGTFRGTVGVLRDVSERETRGGDPHRWSGRFEEFAGLLAHDLRNPLNVVTANLEALAVDREAEALEAALAAADRMERLVERMLRLARAGRTMGEPEAVTLSAVCEQARRAVELPEAGAVEVAGDRELRADAERLQVVLENLFRNAVEHAGPEVTVTVGPCEGGFYVADDGPGLPDGDPETLFEPGYSTAADGTGLGLAIVRRVVEAHGGTVTATEGEQGGARFEIRGLAVDDVGG